MRSASINIATKVEIVWQQIPARRTCRVLFIVANLKVAFFIIVYFAVDMLESCIGRRQVNNGVVIVREPKGWFVSNNSLIEVVMESRITHAWRLERVKHPELKAVYLCQRP